MTQLHDGDINCTITTSSGEIILVDSMSGLAELSKRVFYNISNLLLLSSAALAPNTTLTSQRYTVKGTRLAPNTSLKNLYILQQALDNYEAAVIIINNTTIRPPAHVLATKAILARFGILKKVDKMTTDSLETLLGIAAISPFPTELLDIYLDVESAYYHYMRFRLWAIIFHVRYYNEQHTIFTYKDLLLILDLVIWTLVLLL